MPGNAAAFFERAEREFTYYGYAEIGMRTERMSDVDFDEVDLRSNVTKRYSLPYPILASPMNCISEDKMAIAMGLVGGGAFIHHCNTPNEQAELVEKVHHYLNGIIPKPWDAKPEETISDVLTRLEKRDKRFRTLPVVDNEGRCTGLMDETCFKLFDPQTLIRDAMRPFGKFITAQVGITPNEAYEKMREERLAVLPLLDTERRIGGLCLVDDIVRVVNSNPHDYSLSETGRLLTFASVPTIPEDAVERVRLMYKHINVVTIDTSHGEHKYTADTMKALKAAYGNSHIDFVWPNISTRQTSVEAAKFEPDAITCGQGPGQICKSSDRLGFGTPQASAVYEVAQGARSIDPDMPVLADGGIGDSADSVKAYALGANGTKVGGLPSGCDETPVPVLIDEQGVPYREYWGMASEKAQQSWAAARARYGNFGDKPRKIYVEGFVKRVPPKGPVADVINDHMLGVKLAFMAHGVRNIREMQEHAVFMYGNNKKN